MTNSEKVKTALARIEEGVATIESDKDWIKFLRFQSSFYHYSFGNAMLIFLQNPEATYVAGYKAWLKMGRHVRKGSKGLVILAPCTKKIERFKEPEIKAEYHDEEAEKEIEEILSGFRIAHVFDIADTEGDDDQLPVLVGGLSGGGETEKEIYDRLYAVISRQYCIKDVNGTASKGSFNLDTHEISIRTDLAPLQKIKTLLHELSHGLDFEMNPDQSIHRNIRELVAESSAFVVATRLGLDTSRYSVSYIRSWLKDEKELKMIGNNVQRVASRIFSMLAESEDSAFSYLKEE